MSKKLLCYARGRPGEWEAICVDFDIAVQGRSFEEVSRLLEESVADYIISAGKEQSEAAQRLLSRRVPLRVHLGYLLAFIWHAIRGRRRQDDDRLEHSFQMPCPA